MGRLTISAVLYIAIFLTSFYVFFTLLPASYEKTIFFPLIFIVVTFGYTALFLIIYPKALSQSSPKYSANRKIIALLFCLSGVIIIVSGIISDFIPSKWHILFGVSVFLILTIILDLFESKWRKEDARIEGNKYE